MPAHAPASASAPNAADAPSASAADDPARPLLGPRHDFSSDVMRGAAVLGMVGTVLATSRWAAAFNYNRQLGQLPLWALSMTPFGPGVTNKIVPYESGMWAKAYRWQNQLGTVMSAVNAGIAIPNLVTGFKQGWDSAEGQGPVSQAAHGVLGLVATRAGRTGLIGAVGPALTAGIIVGAGWGAREKGLMAVLRAGQESPLRGSLALGIVGMVLGPVMWLNEAGALDALNLDREPGDHRSPGDVFLDGLRSLPETIRSLGAPYVPRSWVPQP